VRRRMRGDRGQEEEGKVCVWERERYLGEGRVRVVGMEEKDASEITITELD
jgi:hypothetical protein